MEGVRMRRNREEIIKIRFTILNHLKNISRGRLFNRHKDIDIAFVNVGTNMLILEYENSNQEEKDFIRKNLYDIHDELCTYLIQVDPHNEIFLGLFDKLKSILYTVAFQNFKPEKVFL